MRQKILIILLLGVGWGMSCKAQPAPQGMWWMYFGSQSFAERWNWHNEVQYRNFNFAGDLEQLLLRTGIGYNLTPGNNNVLLGYGYILSEPYLEDEVNKRSFGENRIFQQFITNQAFGRWQLQHRYRFEQRWVEGQDFSLRYRYFLAMRIALSRQDWQPNTLYLSLYNEVFVHGTPRFDRNRSYAALGWHFSKNLRVEAGWMTQFYTGSHRSQFQLAVFNTFPFSR